VADDVAAGHRAARVMRIGERGEDGGAPRNAAPEDGESLVGGPAEVRAARSRDRQVVDLLIAVVADVADRDRLGGAVEREAPRVAQAVGPDLVPAGSPYERVVGGDRVRRAAAGRGVDSQDLAEKEIRVLR